LPRLSVVLLVRGRQAWVEPTVRSVLGQESADAELVAIDHASPDHAPEILDRLASADDRMAVRHLAAGDEARGAAVEAAAGEYLWCIEPGDELLPGSLARVVARLADQPDLLIVGHSVADALNRLRRGPRLPAKPDVGALARTTGGAVHDKVVRRDLEPGWTGLLTAGTIAVEREPALVHRPQPRDVLAEYEAAFAAVPADRAALLVEPMLRDVFAELERSDDPRALFARLADAYRRHHAGPLPTGPVWRARIQALERGVYPAYRAVEQARSARASISRFRGRTTERARTARIERHYRRQLEQPLDPELAVYAAYWFRGYACNPRAIYEKARELVPEVRGVWAVKESAADTIPPGVEHVIAGSPEYYDAIARASVLVNNVNFPDHLVARQGAVHVQTHHGTPLKRMGLDLRETAVAGRRMDFNGLLRRVGRWDYSVSQNVFSTLVWERVYPGHYESLEVGYPRNDVLATATEADVARARTALGIAGNQTAVLYAPTHREYLNGFAPTVDLARLADALGPDHVLLVRLHYFYDSDPLLRRLHDAGAIRDVASHPSIEELSLAADVLLTDYSSLMFDYAVLDRPIVIHAPDWDTYRTMRGTYFDLMAEPPGTVTRTEPELIDALSTRASWGEEPAVRRHAFRERFCSLDDGRAAERVVRRLWP
jgi:CDP-glycerol glycerophosphotransferase